MNDETLDHSHDEKPGLAALFELARSLPEERWETFLERERPDDPGLRDEVLRALRGAARAGSGFLSPASDPAVPPGLDRIGKYQVVRRFAESSGQAAAYLAFDPDLRRHVVLKQYHDADTPEGRRSATEEGRALARIKSPFVAQCLGIELLGDDAFLVVEYIPGRNLAEVRRDGSLDMARTVAIMSQLCEGVARVHECGLVHRDIKPANVVLGEDGRPRLVDFGLAAHLGGDRLREWSGTPAYMAPEQARGEPERIDFRTDVFGLGAVLYELLTGRPPYTGPTRGETLEQARRAVVVPPRQIEPAIPTAFEAACLKALAAAPENRFATPLDFASDLRAAIEPTPKTIPLSPPWSRRILPAAVVACGVLAAVAWFWPKDPKPSARFTPVEATEEVEGPLRAEIVVELFKESGDGKRVQSIGKIGEKSLDNAPPRLKDMVRVHVALSRPAYAYLIALNPDGTDQICIVVRGDEGGPPRRELVFPADPGEYFGLTDGVGLQAFVAVVSDRPLPAYDAWKATVPGGLTWLRVDREGIWTYDSEEPTEARRLVGMLRGATLKREAAAEVLIGLCDRLRQSPGVSLVRALAFPVKPDAEIIK